MTDKFIAKIGEAFFEIERRESLYDWKVGDIYVWSVIRSRLFKVIMKNSKLFNYDTNRAIDIEQYESKYHGRYPMKLLAWAMLGMARKPRQGEPDFRNLGRFDAVVVPFSTRDANLEDKFSKPITEALGGRALTLGVGTWDKITAAPRIDDLNRWMIEGLGPLGSIIVRLIVRKADYEKYRRVVKFLEAETGVSMAPYDRFPRWTFSSFIVQRWAYRILFKRTNAKVLFAVNAARFPLQAAAQERGIRIVEIQSGVFSKYSLQFSWPGSPTIPYIPDEIWTWGEYWTDGIEHAGQQKIRVVGSTAEFEAIRDKNAAKIPGQVVFLAQPLIGLQIFEEAVAFAKARPELNIIFKLHPRNELAEFEGALAALGSAAPRNLKVVHVERSSLEIIAESEYSIGVFSTALIEAAALGSKVGIIKLAGWEHLENLIDRGFAKAFMTGAELAAGLESIPLPADPYFFYGRHADIGKLAAEYVEQLSKQG
ncbi:MAG: hypothetical protein RL605_882 [Actinomycetota bacterium]